MDLLEFIDLHKPALERDQVRHNLIIGLLSSTRDRQDKELMFWLGPPGACAIKTPGRSFVLDELSEAQCHQLAEETATIDYPGVLGLDQTALQFMARAKDLGLRFKCSINQGISALTEYAGPHGASTWTSLLSSGHRFPRSTQEPCRC